MAKVPTILEQRVAAQPFPPVFRRSTATPEAFGAGVARAQGEAARERSRLAIGEATAAGQADVSIARARGESGVLSGRALKELGRSAVEQSKRMAEASDRLARRREVISRFRVINNATEQLKELFAQEQDQGSNFMAQGSVEAFTQGVDTIIMEALGEAENHSPESTLILAQAAEELKQQFLDKATSRAVEALNAEEARLFSTFIGERAQEVGDAPELLGSAKLNVERQLVNFDDTHTPGQIKDMRNAAYQTLALAAFNNYHALGDYDQADKVLKENAAFITPEKGQSARNRLIVGRTEAARADAKINAKLTRLEAAGVSITPGLRIAAEGISLPTPPVTKAQKTAEADAIKRAVTRTPENPEGVGLTEDEVAKLNGFLVAEDNADITGRRGKSKQALAMDNVDEDIVALNNGQLDAQGVMRLLSDVAIATTPNQFGERLEVQPVHRAILAERLGLTDEILADRDAMLDFGVQIAQQMRSGGALPALTQAGQAAQPQSTLPRAEQPQPAPSPPERTVSGARAAITQRALEKIDTGGIYGPRNTAYDFGFEFTGPVAAGGRLVGRVPGGPGGGRFAEAAKEVPLMVISMVNALRVNARGEKEREILADILSLTPKVFQSTADYESGIVGIDKGFEKYEILLTKQLASARVSQERKGELMDTLQEIIAYRSVLMPPRIEGTTREEAAREAELFAQDAPPGTRFLIRIGGEGHPYLEAQTPLEPDAAEE